jgi:hypothetical protein
MYGNRSFSPRSGRAAFGLVVVLLLLALVPGSALAAAPSNDTIAGATAVTIGFSETLDTTQATTDADDAQLNADCGAPATAASVWYSLSGTDQGVVVDVSQSTYSAGVLVGVGTPGSLSIVTCGPGAVSFFAAAGETYYVLAIDDQIDFPSNGGMLSIAFTAVPPPPEAQITTNPYGTFNSKTGTATIGVTFTCTNSDAMGIEGEARQEAGRFTVKGVFDVYAYGACDGTAHNWTALVYPTAGKFAGGKALTISLGYACGMFDCGYGYSEQIVLLQGPGKK